MVEYGSGFARTNISTNGLLVTPENAKRLIASGVSDLIVSIDGVSQEVYEKYRVGGEVTGALRGLLLLHDANLRSGGRVHIMPQFIVFRHNEHEMEEFERLVRSVGLEPLFKAPYLRVDDTHFQLPSDPRFHRPAYGTVEELRTAMRACTNPREVFTILADGTVVICCHDYNQATGFGNIFEQDVPEIWNSPRYRAFREAILSGNAPDFCVSSCMTWKLAPATATPHPSAGARVSEDDALPDRRPAAPSAPPRQSGIKVNLCSGARPTPGYVNVDLSGADINIDLEHELLPFDEDSVSTLVCISAINYFELERGQAILRDILRVLEPGGVVRIGVQDLEVLMRRYMDRDTAFWDQKAATGGDRFPGRTVGEKLNGFFYGFPTTGGKRCRFVYDAETLGVLLREAGFEQIERKAYRESSIPEVAAIDNRPEQMFFVEARKPSPARSREPGPAGRNGDDERSWQLLLEALERSPGDRQLVDRCATVLRTAERPADLVRLYDAYLRVHAHDAEVSRLRADAANAERSAARETPEMIQRRTILQTSDFHETVPHSDRVHLEKLVEWLCRAQDAHPGGGVASLYHLDTQQWDVDYPETTGYIIPTFLHYSQLTGDRTFAVRAERMADWEISLQHADGGIGEPVGVFGQQPRVFNTSQVILGFLAAHSATGAARFLEAAARAAAWIAERQEADGRWSRNTYRGPRAYKSRVAWSLLETGKVTGDRRLQRAGAAALHWSLAQALPNGWFAENSLTDPEAPWTHLIAYALQGVQESSRLIEDRTLRLQAERTLQSAADALARDIMARKGNPTAYQTSTLPATFDRAWTSRDSWSCLTGTAQTAYFLRSHPGAGAPGSPYRAAADALIDDLKRRHFLDARCGDQAAVGGVPGSFPLAAPYCSFAIPNWGVKFFADCLLQRLTGRTQLPLLG
jgi:predicted SAM-dependent methyltransferase